MIKNEASNDKGCPVAEEITVTGMALGVLSSLLLSPCGEFDDDDDDDVEVLIATDGDEVSPVKFVSAKAEVEVEAVGDATQDVDEDNPLIFSMIAFTSPSSPSVVCTPWSYRNAWTNCRRYTNKSSSEAVLKVSTAKARTNFL